MMMPADVRNRRETLSAMILELQNNQITLTGLLSRYGVFLFTGGEVPRGRWDLVAMTAYLERPFAADRISTAEAERYRHLAEAIMDLGQTSATGARTLRCRHDIGDMFGRDSSEIRALGSSLESAMTTLVEELRPSPLLSETESTMESVESDFSPNGVLGATTGGEQ